MRTEEKKEMCVPRPREVMEKFNSQLEHIVLHVCSILSLIYHFERLVDFKGNLQNVLQQETARGCCCFGGKMGPLR